VSSLIVDQLFGYIQTSAEEMEDVMVGEEVSIFTVSKRRRVGEAAGKSIRAYARTPLFLKCILLDQIICLTTC